MTTLIALLRASRLALHIAYGLSMALIYPWLSRVLKRHILRCWSLKLLRILNVHVVMEDADLRALNHGLIVTNHISWLDIFVLNSRLPMRFVAKSEVRGWPVIGWLCERAGTLFIERGKARAAARMNVQLAELLQRGERLAVFPEGTTTDGRAVAHFHASLLQPAIDAGVRVHPMAIRYQEADGRMSMVAAYIDDLSFGASLWRILTTPELHVRLLASAPLTVTEIDRRALAQQAHDLISHSLRHADSSNFHVSLTPLQQSDLNLLPSTR